MRAVEADTELLRRWPLPDLSDGESKEDRGRVVVIGGSREIPGAALLAAYASLRAGAGKLHIATVADVAPAMAIAMPEARVSGLVSTPRGEIAAVTYIANPDGNLWLYRGGSIGLGTSGSGDVLAGVIA